MGSKEICIVPQKFDGFMWGFSIFGRKPKSAFEWAQSSVAMTTYITNHMEPLFQRPVFFALIDDPLNTEKQAEVEIPLIRREPEKVTKDSFGPFSLGGGVLHVAQHATVAAILIPGAPQVGIGHSGSVVHVSPEGDIYKMISDENINLCADPDIAVLSSVLLDGVFL
jgi:hypothetical protein